MMQDNTLTLHLPSTHQPINLDELVQSSAGEQVQSITIIVPTGQQSMIYSSETVTNVKTVAYRIQVQERAQLSWWFGVTIAQQAVVQQTIIISAEKHATANLYLCVHVEGNYTLKLTADLPEPKSFINIYGGYFAGKQGNYVITSLQNHQAPSTESRLTMHGVVQDQAQVAYEGNIAIGLKAENADAGQLFKTILQGPAARATAKPALEVKTNAVKCGHGAAIGPLDAAQLLYMAQRGLDNAVAEQLLINTFVQSVYTTLPAPLRLIAQSNSLLPL